MASKTSIIERDRVPLVPSINVDAGIEKVAETVDISGARGREDVAIWYFLEGETGGEVRGVEEDVVDAAVVDGDGGGHL